MDEVTTSLRRVSGSDLREIAQTVWYRLKKIECSETWPLEPAMATSLTQLGLGEIATENLTIQNPIERNIHLRSSLAPYLKGQKIAYRQQTQKQVNAEHFFDWIIYVWGKIPEEHREDSLNTFREWKKDFGSFRADEIQKFIRPNGRDRKDRISSWSKIISFGDHQTYPIYDSVISIALNICLIELGRVVPSCRFYMPISSSERNLTCEWVISEEWGPRCKSSKKYLGYSDFIILLDEMMRQGIVRDRLEGEMAIFGRARQLINEYYGEIQNNLSPTVQTRIENRRLKKQEAVERKQSAQKKQ